MITPIIFLFLIALTSILILVFEIMMFIDALKQKNISKRIGWSLFIFFLPLIGAVTYFIVVKARKKRK